MATPKRSKTVPIRKRDDENVPVLVKVDESFIDPGDVSAVRAVETKNGQMYVIDRFSQPTPAYTLWADESEIAALIAFFNVIEE